MIFSSACDFASSPPASIVRSQATARAAFLADGMVPRMHPSRKQQASTGADNYTYISEMSATTVNAYQTGNRENGGPVCEVGPVRFAEGITVDGSGTLYVVTHFQRSIGVATFAPNCGKAGPTYVFPHGGPDDPAVDGKTLYVTEPSDRINVYDLSRRRYPIRKLSHPAVAEGIGLAVDSHHNLFWATLAHAWMEGQVIEFSGGKMPGKLLKATRIGTDFPGGLLFDRDDNLLLVDQTAREVFIYASPYDAPAFQSIPLKGAGAFCALDAKQTHLYCLDYQYGEVDAYRYPDGAYLYSYNTGIGYSPIGIAIAPSRKR